MYHDERTALLGTSRVEGFNYRNRPYRDVFWSLTFFILFAGTIGTGVYSVVNGNKKFISVFSPDSMSDPSLCPLHSGLHDLSLEAPSGKGDIPLSVSESLVWLAVTLLGSLFVGVFFLLLARKAPGLLVKLAVGVYVAVPVAMTILALIAGDGKSATVFGVIVLVTAVSMYFFHDQLAFVTKLLGLAAHALSDTPGVVVFSVCFQVLATLCISVLSMAAAASLSNGKLAFNPSRDTKQSKCLDFSGQPINCCIWKPEPWAPYAATVSSLAVLWTTCLVYQIKIYTIAGATAQWYWAPVSYNLPASTTWIAFTAAMGPSFGSLCLGSALIAVFSLIRAVVETIRRKKAKGEQWVLILVQMVVRCIGSVLEFITKFATIRAAITGESFITAGRNVYSLLVRNALNTVTVWWFPSFVLHTCALVLAAAWGVLIGFISYNTTFHVVHASVMLGVVAGVVAWLVISFFASITLNIMEALYICYALDKEEQTCRKPQVHEVYYYLPGCGHEHGSAPNYPAQATAPPSQPAYGAPYSQQPYPHATYPQPAYQQPGAPYGYPGPSGPPGFPAPTYPSPQYAPPSAPPSYHATNVAPKV